MNHNRSHDYENYKNSYGIQELFRAAREARMLKEAGSDKPGTVKVIQLAMRLMPVAIIVALLIQFLG